MSLFKQASDVLDENHEAIIVYTHGDQFVFDALGNGYTGNWVIDPEMVDEVDKVMIYLRKENESISRIFLGNYAGIRPSEEARRYIIRFSRLKEIGTTDSNWLDFAAGGQNPISYISK